MTDKENLSHEQILMFAGRHGIEADDAALIGFARDVESHAAVSLAAPGDAWADERGAFEEKFAVPDSIVWRDERYHVLGVTTGSHQVERFCGRWDGWQARASMAPTPQQISDYLSGLDAINRALVEREARAAAPQAEAAQSEDRIDALQDMAFANGLQLGWNFGSNGAREDYEQALKARDGYVRVLRETRAAPSPDREQVGETDTSPSPLALSKSEQDVIAERHRQVSVEGWTPEHDDELDTGTLASAAMSYIAFAADLLHPMSQGDGFRDAEGKPPMWWPFDASWWKPTTPRRALEKGVALALAEIEHIDRAAEAKRSRAR